MISPRIKVWVLAARPKTLVATVAPISIGAALAYGHGTFMALNLCAAIMAGVFIQVGTNLANDYFDFKKGADTADRVGPRRVTQSGLISPSAVRNGFLLCFMAASIIGLYLVYGFGWPIFMVGLISLICGLAYTAGPWPLAYHGLGELFVLFFFGPISTGFTYYVVTAEYNAVAFGMGVCPGLLSCGILIANNLRDIKQDKEARKNTLAVRFGEKFSKIEYLMVWVFAYFVLFFISWKTGRVKMLAPVLMLPFSLSLCLEVFKSQTPNELIKVLEGTAIGLVVFAALTCLGILL